MMRTQKRKTKSVRTGLAILLVLLLAFGGVMTVLAANPSDQAAEKANENASFKNANQEVVEDESDEVVEDESVEIAEEENEENEVFVAAQVEEEPEEDQSVGSQATQECNEAVVSRNQLNKWGQEQIVVFNDGTSKVYFTTYQGVYEPSGATSGENTLIFRSDIPITKIYVRHSNLETTFTAEEFNELSSGEQFVIIPGKQIHELIFNPCGEVVIPTTYKVFYDGSDETSGDVPTDSGNYAAGDLVTVLGQGTLEKDGYTFGGWETDDLGGVTEYFDEGDTFDMPAKDVTLYAVWVEDDPDTYTVTYDANGGAGDVPTDDGEYEELDEVTVLGQGALTRDGYTFDGWETYDLGEATEYFDEGDTFDMPANNVTLYAKWNEDQNGGGGPGPTTYTVSYDGNGNTSGTAPIDPNSPYAADATVTVLGNSNLAKTGFAFAGWNTESDGEGTAYAAGDTFTITANTTLYAIWNEIVIETPPPTSGGRTSSRTSAVPRENVPEFVDEILEVVVEPQIPEAAPIMEIPVLDEAPLAAPPVLPQTGDAGVLATILSGLGVSLSGLAMKFRKKGKDDSVTTLFK
jgi:uncharacterized repeat protein (TIGR02543 family)/LPXTG-motif cell wall-anchored protein